MIFIQEDDLGAIMIILIVNPYNQLVIDRCTAHPTKVNKKITKSIDRSLPLVSLFSDLDHPIKLSLYIFYVRFRYTFLRSNQCTIVSPIVFRLYMLLSHAIIVFKFYFVFQFSFGFVFRWFSAISRNVQRGRLISRFSIYIFFPR